MASITLRPEARDAILDGSPWVRTEDIARLEGAPSLGDAVWLRDHHGDILGSGFYAPGARIPLRLMSRDPGERIDRGAIHRRIHSAIAMRAARFGLPREDEEAVRLIHGEADELPGFFVDRLGDVAILRVTCPALLRYEDDLVGAIARAIPGGTLYGAAALGSGSAPQISARADAARIGKDRAALPAHGLRLLRGEDQRHLSFLEGGARLEIPLEHFEASGFSLAHRPIRAAIAGLVRDKELLEIGAGSSLVSLRALSSGARAATAIEPEPLLAASLRASAERASLSDRLELLAQRHPSALRALHAAGRRFDCICLLPSLARGPNRSRRGEYDSAHLGPSIRLALRLLRDEGVLILGSRPGARSNSAMGALDESLRRAARMESRQAFVFERATAGPDFPALVGFDEAPSVEALFAIVRRRRRSGSESLNGP